MAKKRLNNDWKMTFRVSHYWVIFQSLFSQNSVNIQRMSDFSVIFQRITHFSANRSFFSDFSATRNVNYTSLMIFFVLWYSHGNHMVLTSLSQHEFTTTIDHDLHHSVWAEPVAYFFLPWSTQSLFPVAPTSTYPTSRILFAFRLQRRTERGCHWFESSTAAQICERAIVPIHSLPYPYGQY